MPTYAHEDVVVWFADKLAGMSVSALLTNKFIFRVTAFPNTRGDVFSLLSPEYRIQMVIDDGYVALRRNQYEARKEIGRVERHFQILASWKPDQFQLALMVDDDVGDDEACVTIDTEPIYVPISLLDWARRFNLIHRTTYHSAAEFLGIFLESLRQAGSTIRDTNSYNLFWDRQRATDAPQRIVPKREPEAMSGVAAFLQDQSLLAGYQLLKESQAGAGSLDLRALAPRADGGFVNVCVEGKNAHSPDLEHGITDQLPAYMRSTNADYGVYLVLWYRCKVFPEPEEDSLDVTLRLSKRRPWPEFAVSRHILAGVAVI